MVKTASIHHEQTPPIRTERQIVPSTSLSHPDERQKAAPTTTPAAPRPTRPVQNDTVPVIPERKRAAPVVKESNFTIRRTTARKEWTKTDVYKRQPFALTWFMCQKTFDGKKPYGFLKSVLAYLVRPKLTYAGKPVKLEKEYPAQPITAVRSDIYGISD